MRAQRRSEVAYIARYAEYEKRSDNREPCVLRVILYFRIERAAENAFDAREEDQSAVEHRYRKQVHDKKRNADKGHEFQNRRDALSEARAESIFDGIPEHVRNADGT